MLGPLRRANAQRESETEPAGWHVEAPIALLEGIAARCPAQSSSFLQVAQEVGRRALRVSPMPNNQALDDERKLIPC